MSKFAEDARKRIEEAKEDRMNEINFVVGMVDNLCREAGIALIPHEIKKDFYVVAVKDNRSGKVYCLKNAEEK